jgi:hypothetical protein
MRATLRQNYLRIRSRVSSDEQHIRRVRTFIVYVLFVLLLLWILYQTIGMSFNLSSWFKSQVGIDGVGVPKDVSQVVYPLPDDVSCRFVWFDRRTMEIRKDVTGLCNKNNKAPETAFAPTRGDASGRGQR